MFSITSFSLEKGKEITFSPQITVFHTILKTSKIAILFFTSRKALLYKKAHQNEQNDLWSEEAHIKSLTCSLNQDKEPTLGCPTSIWDAVINTASLPSARCQFVELLLGLPSLFQMSSLFAVSHACSHSFCVPSAF